MNCKDAMYAASFILLLAHSGAIAQTATDVDCDKCVQKTDLAFGAVQTGQLKDNAVTNRKLASGSVDWQQLALSLQQRILDLEARLDQLEGNSVLALDGYLELDDSDIERPAATFTGVNVQVQSGLGHTYGTNGVGNLIVGYDELADENFLRICSDGDFDNQVDCEANGYVWSANHKSGSHNVIVGGYNRYSSYAGIVVGEGNGINNHWAAAIAGHFNVASGSSSGVFGGRSNKATGIESVVSGGWHNTASGARSGVTGGELNTASGDESAVSGGYSRSAVDQYDWAAGSLLETQ